MLKWQKKCPQGCFTHCLNIIFLLNTRVSLKILLEHLTHGGMLMLRSSGCLSQLVWRILTSLFGVVSEGVGTEVVINPVSSQKALIIQDDVAKCHRTHFLSPTKMEPLKDKTNDPDLHLFPQNSQQIRTSFFFLRQGITAVNIMWKIDTICTRINIPACKRNPF